MNSKGTEKTINNKKYKFSSFFRKNDVKIINNAFDEIKNDKSSNTSQPTTTTTENNNNNDSLCPLSLEAHKKLDNSISTISIDSNVDFTVIKADSSNNEKDIENDSDDSRSKRQSSRKNRNKNKLVVEDIEILNVDDIEQTEEITLKARRPMGYDEDYYIINQELFHTNNKMNSSTEKQTEGTNYEENEPKLITNAFFTESDHLQQKKDKKLKKLSKKDKSKSNDRSSVEEKNNNKALSNSEKNSSSSMECEINDIIDYGKINKNKNMSVNTNDENGSIHPFSVI